MPRKPEDGEFLLMNGQSIDYSETGMRFKSTTEISSSAVLLILSTPDNDQKIEEAEVIDSVRNVGTGTWEYRAVFRPRVAVNT